MPFGRLHEEAAGDSKLLALSDAAWRMWGMGLIYCQKNLTDGFIPEHAVDTFGVRGLDIESIVDRVLQGLGTAAPRVKGSVEAVLRRTLVRTPRIVAQELCTSQVPGKQPLWEPVEGGYQIHDYLDWNDSKDEILKMRAQSRERVHRYRQRNGQALPPAQQTELRHALHEDVQRAHTSGTWSVEKREEGTGEKPDQLQPEPAERRQVPDRRRLGVMDGALPRDHVTHSACSPNFSWCVPSAVHGKLVTKLSPKFAGDRAQADRELQAWYPTVWTTLTDDFVMRDAFRFWEHRFDAVFATPEAPVSRVPQPVSNVPSASATRQYLREMDR